MPLPFAAEHRLYPPPARAFAMWQRWHDLLFMHYPISLSELRPLVPAALPLDDFEGQGWIGIVPFRMTNIRARYWPSLPWLSAFPELNVRTYVKLDGRPGVYFFSLDASRLLAVKVARRWFHLNYVHARIGLIERDGWIAYDSRRLDRGAPQASLQGRYRPVGEPYLATPGTLEHWLTERYCMYPVDAAGNVYRGEIHHAPWPLQRAEAEFGTNTMTEPLGWKLPAERPVLHFARRLDVVVWTLERLATDGTRKKHG